MPLSKNSFLRSPYLFVAFLLVPWLIAVRQLSLEWTVNSLYHYGWWVIPLAAYLFVERISDAPAPKSSASARVALGLVVSFFLISYTPFRIIQEANFDWILLNWFAALMALSLTLYFLLRSLGKEGLLHFLFPVLFIFSSIPWPVGFENAILQNLMRVNAVITAQALTIGSIDAVAHGNIIEVAGQLIGVEEACSGIRSLQTSLMMSLFLGEFYRIRISSRIWLVFLSFFLSFVFNASRTVALTYVGASEGLHALESWHDPLGYGVLGISLVGLWGIAYWFSMNEPQPNKPPQKITSWLSSIEIHRGSTITFVILLGVAFTGEIITEGWYRSKERNLTDSKDFSIDFPTEAKYYTEHPFSDITKSILKFNEGRSATWLSAERDEWGVYLLEWEPQRVSKKLVSAHTPEVCYPAAGYKLETLLGNETILVKDIPIAFNIYLFSQEGQNFYVFHGIWEEKYDDLQSHPGTEPLTRNQRIQAVIQGKRNLGQKILGVSLLGPRSLNEAKSKLKTTLNQIVRPSHD